MIIANRRRGNDAGFAALHHHAPRNAFADGDRGLGRETDGGGGRGHRHLIGVGGIVAAVARIDRGQGRETAGITRIDRLGIDRGRGRVIAIAGGLVLGRGPATAVNTSLWTATAAVKQGTAAFGLVLPGLPSTICGARLPATFGAPMTRFPPLTYGTQLPARRGYSARRTWASPTWPA